MSEIDDKELEVSIPADEPVTVNLGDDAPVIEKKAETPTAPDVDEREQALAELRKQIEEERARAERERKAREQAERYAQEQEFAAKSAKVEVQDSNLRVILNAIEATEQAASGAERAYADAMAAGDYAQAAKAQRAMAQAESQLLQLKNGKSALEDRLQSQTHEGRVASEAPKIEKTAGRADSVEEMAAQLTPKSAEWLRAHPSAANQVNKLVAAHQAAVELEGITPETPEYFAYIEGKLGFTTPKQTEKPQTAPAKAMASAPVSSASSSGGSSRSGNGSSMTLSPAEVEFALLNEPNLPREKALETYARNKAALIREGKLSA